MRLIISSQLVFIALLYALQSGPADSQPSSVLKVALPDSNLAKLARVDVLRINPWLGRVIAVRPSHAADSYADRATVTYLDRNGQVFNIDTSLIIFLRRQFGFMNY